MEINTNITQFHGDTYDATIDRERLAGQIQRIWSVLEDGKKYSGPRLCELADVSFSALRNRVSDLRVYHGAIIDVERVKEGLFSYQFVRMMTLAERAEYKAKLAAKRGGADRNEMIRTLRQAKNILVKTHRSATGVVKCDIAFVLNMINKRSEDEGWEI